MDFVVVGFGLGALMMLAGFGLRDLGPWLFGSNVSDRSLPEFEMVKTTIRKQTLASIGVGIATAGTGLALVTFAALLARTEDELGTIVVGMSLALAAVGVGAWTYDTIRRYRAAMDMVTSQEQSVLARLTGSHQAEAKQPAPKRADANAADRSPEPLIEEPEDVEEIDPDPESALEIDYTVTASEPQAPETESTRSTGMAERDSAKAETEVHESDEIGLTLRPSPDSAQSHPAAQGAQHTGSEVQQEEPAPGSSGGDLATSGEGPRTKETTPATRWPAFGRPSTQPIAAATIPDAFEVLPPLPGDQDDAFIDEAVRLDKRPELTNHVPSWLFEDLETDLAGTGSVKPEDPIDQFRESSPRKRGSALDRILADEPFSPVKEAPGATDEPAGARSGKPSDDEDD